MSVLDTLSDGSRVLQHVLVDLLVRIGMDDCIFSLTLWLLWTEVSILDVAINSYNIFRISVCVIPAVSHSVGRGEMLLLQLLSTSSRAIPRDHLAMLCVS